jgi:hypothetical protein
MMNPGPRWRGRDESSKTRPCDPFAASQANTDANNLWNLLDEHGVYELR